MVKMSDLARFDPKNRLSLFRKTPYTKRVKEPSVSSPEPDASPEVASDFADIEPRLQYLRFESDGGHIARLTLDRPDKNNAFNARMIGELIAVFDRVAASHQIRVLVLAAAGRAFSAGGDIGWMRAQADLTEAQNEADALQLATMLRKLDQLPQFTLALVQGAALGGGLGLIAACDYVCAMEGASFRFSETRLGLTPATISPFVIAKIGAGHARALFTSAMPFEAREALSMGLVHRLCADETELANAGAQIVQFALEGAPGAVRDCKELVAEVALRRVDLALSRFTAQRIAKRRASAEGQEGLKAFLERRSAVWVPKRGD